ncbi:50S ribosomal protein L4 [Patescibacteria group bacterium]|nr:50S ribosomal protein L4 [Patescibacteria group bacterium]
MKASVYNIKGSEVGSVELPEALFDAKRNDALLRQIVLGIEANKRTPVAHTKGRGDVRGGGKKPWKQKGTGRARHGSIRSPIWRGGGTTHGPLKDKDYSQKLNKKMRAKAVAIALTQKMKDGRLLFVDSLPMTAPKTKDAKAALGGLAKVKGFAELATRRNNAALFLLSGKSDAVMKSFSNMGNVMTEETRNANPVDILKYRYLVVVNPEASVKLLASRLESK